MTQNLDVEHELAELRARVRRVPPSERDLTELQKAIAGVNANWHISANLPPPAPGAPLLWRTVYFVKRVIRRIMVEVLNTVVQQQNGFNHQVARTLTELAAQETRLQDLEVRLAQVEKSLNRDS